MPTIIIRSFEELLGSLPDWRPLQPDIAERSVFVAAAGFEDRTTAVCEQWLAGCKDQPCAILIKYRTNIADNEGNLHKLRTMLKDQDAVIEEVDYDQRTISTKFARALGQMVGTSRVLIDISSMASFIMYPVLRAVCDAVPDRQLSIVYAEAQKYYPEKNEWESFWKTLVGRDLVGRAELFEKQYFQSKGAERIYEAMNFVGKNPSELPGKLVMIPNFSFHRVFNMREHALRSLAVDRSDVEWIIGKPPDDAKNGWRADAVYKLCDQPKHCEYCCTLNYKDILAKLQSIWEDNYATRSIAIATLGSKAQHVGTFLFLLMHPEVSLVLSEPEAFVADRFSERTGELRQLDFGRVDGLLSAMTHWNHIDFVW